MEDERALTNKELIDALGTYVEREVKVAFAGMHIPIIGVRYFHDGDEIVLDVGSLWQPAEWHLEERKDRPHKERPQGEPEGA